MKIRFDPIIEQHQENLRNYESQFPFFAPPIASFLKYEFWGIHEAVFALTKWPTYGLCSAWISGLPPEVRKSRSSYYLPAGTFDAEKLPEDAKNLFYKMKLAIDNGSLFSINAPLGDGISFILKPREVIAWALFNNHILPLDLQAAIKFYQQSNSSNDMVENRVKTQCVGQFLMLQNPRCTVTELCNHELMRLFGGFTSGEITEGRRRKDLNALFKEIGKRGRPPKNKQDRAVRAFRPEPLLEVMHLRDGVPCYNFRLLEVFTTTLVQIKIALLGSNTVSSMSRSEFKKAVIDEKIIQLYLPDNSEGAMEFIMQFCNRALNRFLPIFTQHMLRDFVRKNERG